MEFPSIPRASIDLNLSLTPSSNQETTHENIVFLLSNFHTISPPMEAANMHNEIPVTINMLTPLRTWIASASEEPGVCFIDCSSRIVEGRSC
ncbi:hypothetical protein L3X38_007423 [Prunus dulcis]|uniref:Uncharacterized protein n=1 Tax=Prunus dulcis TaxID=3755 RepID=A0AAD5F646_PRUDU|nr:hypothetical protein L3X38_007423 [Prunus dulcis]